MPKNGNYVPARATPYSSMAVVSPKCSERCWRMVQCSEKAPTETLGRENTFLGRSAKAS